MSADKFRRIADLQKQLQRAAEWRLEDLRQQQHQLRAAERETLQALADDSNLCAGLVPALVRRLGRLATEADAVSVAKDQQAEVVLERTRLVELAHRRRRAADYIRERGNEAATLDELADHSAGSPGARLR
jgi:hypothetical protein